MHKPRLLFLFSDTGGGHRSAAEAVIETVESRYPGQFRLNMVDFLKEYAPYPFNRLPDYYPEFVRHPKGWERGFKRTNSPLRVDLMSKAVWPYVRSAVTRLLSEHPADLVVSVHPIANAPLLRGLGQANRNRPPYIVVVTDLVSTHAFWFHRQADLTIVPTRPALDQAIECGLPPERLKLVGLPVAARFAEPDRSPALLRAELGWPQDRPTILLLGGGDGMGPIEATARAIAGSGLKVCLAIITGRNESLRQKLAGQRWPVPVLVYGFVDQMPDFMRAAHILVTKAGPGTISEALTTGLPVLMYSFLPGQEEGNVTYLTDHGAGVWAPTPGEVVSAVGKWIEDEKAYERAVEASRSLGRPNAAGEIADILAAYAKG